MIFRATECLKGELKRASPVTILSTMDEGSSEISKSLPKNVGPSSKDEAELPSANRELIASNDEVTSTANQNFQNFLTRFSLINWTIQSGEC
jgi:hypothetical protein